MTTPVKKPVIFHLPVTDDTIDRITRYRLQRNEPRWRWDLNESGISGMIRDLPKEAWEAVVAARQAVFDRERAVVASLLTDIEAIGRQISAEMEEQ